jgi:hypothetical protein
MQKETNRMAGVTDATCDVREDMRALRENLGPLAQEGHGT